MEFRVDYRRVAGFVGLGVVVFGLCFIAARYFQGAAGIAAIWPANALVLAFKLRACPTRACSRAALGVAFLAMIAANLAVDRPLAVSLAFPVANIVEIALAAWFMRRVTMPLSGMRDLGQFLLGGVVAGPLASTVLAAGVMATAQGLSGEALVGQAVGWLLADVTGMAIVAPFALSLGSVRRNGWLQALAAPSLIGVTCFILCWQTQAPVFFLAFPMVTLAVLMDRDRGGALSVGAVAAAVACAGLLGTGPIARLPEYGLQPAMLIQVFLGALVLTVYPLSTALKRLDVIALGLERRRRAAEQDSQAKSELLGRVGEDIRSPLTGVVTVAEMLRSGRLGELNARQRDLLGRIAESGAEIEALSREMMVLADGKAAEPRLASVAGVIQSAVEAARFQARRKTVEFELLTGAAGWEVAIDAERLKRILLDGLAAALEVSAPHDRIRIVAGLEGRDRVRITVEDGHAPSVQARAARLDDPLNPLAIDRVDLTRFGAGLDFGAGALGGGRLAIDLPLAKRLKAAA